MNLKPKIRVPYIDFLRLISILAVVLIHTSTKTIEASSNNLSQYPFSLFLNQISRFAVPVFFYISGFNLEFNSKPGFVQFLKKRLNRLLLPYLFWTIFYMIIVYPHSLLDLPKFILLGEASYQFYFIPSLIILYLSFPIINYFKKKLFNQRVLLILFLIEIFLLNLDYYFKPLSLPKPVSVALLNFFPFILGAYSVQKSLIVPKKLAFITTILLAVGLFTEGWLNFINTQNYLSFYSQWRPSVLIYSFFIIQFIFQTKFRNLLLIQKLSKLSFFVYFVHVAVIELFWPYLSRYYQYLGFDLVFFILISVVSFSLANFTSKIPLLTKLTS